VPELPPPAPFRSFPFRSQPPPPPPPEGQAKSSTGLIVGAVIGTLVLVAIAISGIFTVMARKRGLGIGLKAPGQGPETTLLLTVRQGWQSFM
jgi:hypothetical protein